MANVVVGQGLWYASFFVLAILVAPSDFGVVAVAAVIVNLTILFMSSGVGGSLIIARTLDARSVRREVIRTSATGIVLTVLFAALATPIADKFAKGSDPAALRALAPIIALIAVAIVPTALLTKNMQFKRIALITISASFAGAVAGVIAAALGAGVWALIIRLGLYQVLVCVLTWVAAFELFPRGDSAAGPSRAREGARAFLAIAVAAFVAWEGDTMVVAGSTNTTQVGFYALAFSLAYAPLSQVSWTVGSVLLPAVASTQDRAAVREQALKATRLMALLLLPLLPASIALAPGLIPTLLGEKWAAAVVPFQILILVGVGQGILNMLGEVFAGAGGRSLYRRAYTDVVWAVATLAAIAVGVQVAGIRVVGVAHDRDNTRPDWRRAASDSRLRARPSGGHSRARRRLPGGRRVFVDGGDRGCGGRSPCAGLDAARGGAGGGPGGPFRGGGCDRPPQGGRNGHGVRPRDGAGQLGRTARLQRRPRS
jgi:O-antigen/teichoic acid export membrane protein